MWSPHEEYAICRELDRPVFFQSALSGSFRMDQGLLLLALYRTCSPFKTTYTFDDYSTQAVSDENNGASPGLRRFSVGKRTTLHG